MRKIESFEDLEIWKEGMQITIKIYKLMEKYKDFGLKNQMERSSVSIPSNIAEGFEWQTNKEFIQYLFIAKGSCGELRTQAYLANKLNYICQDGFNTLLAKVKQLSAKIYNLIKTRRKNFK